MAGESAVALAADVAPHARVDLHVLLERTLCLEPLPAQQAEDSHVRACRGEERKSLRGVGCGAAPPIQAGAGASVRHSAAGPVPRANSEAAQAGDAEHRACASDGGQTPPPSHPYRTGSPVEERHTNSSPQQMGAAWRRLLRQRRAQGGICQGLCSIWGRKKDVGGNHNEDTTCQPLFGYNPFKITSSKGRRYLLTLQIRKLRQ